MRISTAPSILLSLTTLILATVPSFFRSNHLAHAVVIPEEGPLKLYDQSVFDAVFNLPFPKDLIDDTKRVVDRSVNWLKTLTHPSVPGYAIRIKDARGALCEPDVVQYSGYLDTAEDKHFFFWFFESRSKPKTDPFVLWLNGGPGCSSMTGLLTELGPCTVAENGNGTIPNQYAWNNNANVLFLDQPIGAGFSYGLETSTTIAAAADMYAMFQLFYLEFPEYSKLDLHITGESYAGHYIPQVAGLIIEENKKVEEGQSSLLHIPLASVAIGNGLTDPLTQYKYYGEYACKNPYGAVVSEEDCQSMTDAYPTCARLISLCYKNPSALTCLPGSIYCNNKIMGRFQKSGKNVYDVRRKCEGGNLCYEIMTWMETYLNSEHVRWELGVGDRKFTACNMALNQKFQFAGDWMRPYVYQIPIILDAGVRVLIYAGDADFICNYMGNKAWTLELEWPGQTEFNAAEDKIWPSEKENYGELRSYKNFHYLRVYKAGHMVPMDQPIASLEMINKWLSDKL